MFGKVILDLNAPVASVSHKYGLEVTDSVFNWKHFLSFNPEKKATSIKGFLLDQKYFPGVGNWMADEIVFRCRFHPARKVNSLSPLQLRQFFKETKFIARYSERKITLELNDIPKHWLFWKRWDHKLGKCPQTQEQLQRITVAGRSSIYSPAWQS